MHKKQCGWSILKYIVLILFTFWTVIPILLVMLTSLKREMDIFQVPFVFIFKPTLDNYIRALSTGDFPQYFMNSLFIAMVSSVLSIIFGAFAAYGITCFRLKSTQWISNIFLLGKLVPSITILLPLFIILSKANLLGTYAGPILAHTAINLPFIVWLLIGFIKDIPPELHASALVDGCNKMQTFWKIIFPILTPALAAAGILAMQLSWNELLFSLQLTSMDTYTLPVGISKFVGSISVDWGKSSAAATITMVPIIIAGFFIQKYLIRGMTMGSVKG
jgi:ABC-type sugar transport system, permease component